MVAVYLLSTKTSVLTGTSTPFIWCSTNLVGVPILTRTSWQPRPSLARSPSGQTPVKSWPVGVTTDCGNKGKTCARQQVKHESMRATVAPESRINRVFCAF